MQNGAAEVSLQIKRRIMTPSQFGNAVSILRNHPAHCMQKETHPNP
jgi:hypothetical protein